MNIPHKFSQLSGEIEYNKVKDHEKCETHLGQLKLLMTEIHFLGKYYTGKEKVVYIGAAEGYHIYIIKKLFKGIKMDLWDPLKFVIKEGDGIKIFNKFFMDEDAEKYSHEKNILFISDIRNEIPLSKRNSKDWNEFEKVVKNDMANQLKWAQIINPKAVSFKFRLPYDEKTIEYLKGDVWLQSYSPASTEMRLFKNGNYDEMMIYDCQKTDRTMAYFNINTRCDGCNKWKKILAKNNIRNIWDNCYCFDIIGYYIKQQTELPVNEKEIMKIFNLIINFLKNRYGKKYDIIYVKNK